EAAQQGDFEHAVHGGRPESGVHGRTGAAGAAGAAWARGAEAAASSSAIALVMGARLAAVPSSMDAMASSARWLTSRGVSRLFLRTTRVDRASLISPCCNWAMARASRA